MPKKNDNALVERDNGFLALANSDLPPPRPKAPAKGYH